MVSYEVFVLTNKLFNKYIRMAKMLSLTRASGLRGVTHETLKRCGVKRDLTKAVEGVPKGSDQYNEGDIVDWLRSLPPDNEEAVAQMIALDATLTQRVKG